MWTIVGLAVFVLATALAVFALRHRPWRGRTTPAGYEATPHLAKGALVGLEIGVRTRTSLEFEVRREGRLDRAAKAIGLAVEAQLGRPAIDDALYFLADDARVISALRADRELADALLALFTPAVAGVASVVRVTCRDGVLVQWVATRGQADQADRIAADAAPAVAAVAARLASAHPGTAPPDPLRWRRTAVLAVASGVLAHGLLDGFRVAVDWHATTIEVAKLWWLALPTALAVLAMLAVLAVALLGRTSRAHFVLVQALLLGVFGAPFGAFAELRDVNMDADASPPQRVTTRVVAKRAQRAGKGGHTYTVELAPWPGQPRGYDLQVRRDDFDLYLVGFDVALIVRQGRLGARWIESVTPAPML